MNYKDALFFIGKSLTINHEEHNKIIVEQVLKSNTVDWDVIVKVSTSHYVFPALYCNFKRANFLHYLPSELAQYMEHITGINRDRNEQIIQQAKEINDVLLANDIQPIFLKGTANLLEGLYEDIAERMVGDIDLLVAKEDLNKTQEIFLSLKYQSSRQNFDDHRHLPRLINKNIIGAVEIHRGLIKNKFDHYFNYNNISDEIITKEGVSFLSFEDQLKLTILALQINDDGYFFKKKSLKHSYDVFLISNKLKKRISSIKSLDKYLNSYLALTSHLLNSKLIKYSTTKSSQKYVRKALSKIGKSMFTQNILMRFKIRFEIIKKSIFNESYRTYIYNKIFDIKWVKRKLRFKPNS